jgi:DNA-binding response OmpR family regulator
VRQSPGSEDWRADSGSKAAYILILEDDQAVADLLCEVFGIRGDRCFVIRSKASAEHFLRGVRPDLVVVDYQLIGGVGLQAARIASKMKVPVIVTSGHLNVFAQVGEAGFCYLQKPFTPAELLALVSRLLGGPIGSGDPQTPTTDMDQWRNLRSCAR